MMNRTPLLQAIQRFFPDCCVVLLVPVVALMPLPNGALAQSKSLLSSQKAASVRYAEKKHVVANVSEQPVEVTGLSDEELMIAQRIELGTVACELGVSVSVRQDFKAPGYFLVHSSKYRFRMTPVVTSTGAIRLEDRQAGAVWLQLPHKSMLMSQKLGSRLANECVSPTQPHMARTHQKNPLPALLDKSPLGSTPVLTAQTVVQ